MGRALLLVLGVFLAAVRMGTYPFLAGLRELLLTGEKAFDQFFVVVFCFCFVFCERREGNIQTLNTKVSKPQSLVKELS